MPKATKNPTPRRRPARAPVQPPAPLATRRTALGAAALPLAATVPPHPAGDPDAVLLTMVARFNHLIRQIESVQNAPGVETLEEERERDASVTPWHDEQDALLPLILDTEAKTLAGVVARARMLQAYDGGYRFRTDDGRGWDEMMVGALLRDLLAVAA